MGLSAHLQRRHKSWGQCSLFSKQVTIKSPGVILDRVLLETAVNHTFFAGIGPTERRLDAVTGVIRKGEADGAGGCNREQVRIAQPMRTNAFLQGGRQA